MQNSSESTLEKTTLSSKRILGTYSSGLPGPTVVLFGGVHGNEPAGVYAIQQTLQELETRQVLIHGKLIGMAGNIEALSRGVRFVDVDLNRIWLFSVPSDSPPPPFSEYAERDELCLELNSILATEHEPLIFIDFHTFSAAGHPFVISKGTYANPNLFKDLPFPIIRGLFDRLPGTMANYLEGLGYHTLVVEGGQHEDPMTVVNLVWFIWFFLAEEKMITVEDLPECFAESLARLTEQTEGIPAVVRVQYHQHVRPEDEFVMYPGYRSFDPVREGEPLASTKHGTIHAPQDGRILMPLYQGQGEDGFFIGTPEITEE